MEERIVATYLRLIKPLRMELKLSLLSRLSAHLQETFIQQNTSQDKLLDRLAGAWEDMPDTLSDEIIQARSVSDKNLDW